ncbi:hypothetical protein [Staphylococcus succinus]|uniref:hypothetical protein n=1 Tax=Staphylococcus succinus TaxID=61015 RepID=UPI00301C079E
MGVELTGLKELESELNKMFSPERVERIIDKGLVAGGQRMLHLIKQEQAKYRETGSTVSEATLSDPMTIGGQRVVKIHWRGPNKRYAIIHLQEQGFYNRDGSYNSPASKGALQRVVIEGRKVYLETVKNEFQRAFR